MRTTSARSTSRPRRSPRRSRSGFPPSTSSTPSIPGGRPSRIPGRNRSTTAQRARNGSGRHATASTRWSTTCCRRCTEGPMPLDKLLEDLKAQLAHLEAAGTAKADEQVVVAVKPPQTGRGPRFLLEDFGDREFIRMNSNAYLGLSLASQLIAAELACAGAC